MGIFEVLRDVDTAATEHLGLDSVGVRDQFFANVIQKAIDRRNLGWHTVSPGVGCIHRVQDSLFRLWGPVLKLLQVGARRGIMLSNILHCLDAVAGAHEACSRILERPKLKGWDLLSFIDRLLRDIKKTVPLLAYDVREALAVVVVAVVLLSYVYLYLTGCGGWGGSLSESSGPLDYQDTYIAILLFRGAYVWIKFRDVAFTKPVPGGAVQPIESSCKGGRIKKKYEPRFKPRKENGVSFSWIYLGRFDSYADAEVVYRMAASCYDYGKGYGTPVDLAGDGREFFTIIPEFTPEEKILSGREKQELVKERVKELYKRYKTAKDALNLPPTSPGTSLEQELQNRRLQSEISSEQQHKEGLACQLQQSERLQQAQQFQIQHLQLQVQDLQRQVQEQQAQHFQIQNLQLQVEILQRQVQDQQAQQNLQQTAQFQVPNLQPQPQPQLQLQQQQREEESLNFDEILDVLFATGFGASVNFGDYPTDG